MHGSALTILLPPLCQKLAADFTFLKEKEKDYGILGVVTTVDANNHIILLAICCYFFNEDKYCWVQLFTVLKDKFPEVNSDLYLLVMDMIPGGWAAKREILPLINGIVDKNHMSKNLNGKQKYIYNSLHALTSVPRFEAKYQEFEI